jgi:hydroxyethylthiazole kinase-like uncharacterized protein yjeF
MNDDAGGFTIKALNTNALAQWPLPQPQSDGDKEERGRFLVIGGSREMPGAVILAANAALRAGAGKLAIGTCASIANLVALAIPESRVIALPETAAGGVAPAAADALHAVATKVDAVLIGPGMQDEASVCEFVAAMLPSLARTKVVLDAAAMGVLRNAEAGDGNAAPNRKCIVRFASPVAVTPHAGEMAHLTGIDKDRVSEQPAATARNAADRWNAVVVLKGAITFIAGMDGQLWRHDGGNVGLAISGSGDTLAGIIGGLASRGATLEQACAWGVVLHARAGDALAARLGPLGYFAREIAGEVPALMHAFGR